MTGRFAEQINKENQPVDSRHVSSSDGLSPGVTRAIHEIRTRLPVIWRWQSFPHRTDSMRHETAGSNDLLNRKERMMAISPITTNTLTYTAIAALKNAYEQCSDTAARESIIAAFKAIIQLHHDLGIPPGLDSSAEIDSDFDPSEYCAAV